MFSTRRGSVHRPLLVHRGVDLVGPGLRYIIIYFIYCLFVIINKIRYTRRFNWSNEHWEALGHNKAQAVKMTMYVRLKRKNQTMFLHVEPSDNFGQIKVRIADNYSMEPSNIMLFASDKVHIPHAWFQYMNR